MLLAVAVAWVVWPKSGLTRPALEHVVVQALCEEELPSYTATATLTMPYRGKTIKSHISLIHTRDAENVTCQPSTNGSAWTIKKPGCSYTYIPGKNTMVVSRYSSLLTPGRRGQLLLANYEAKYAGTQQVAGRTAYVVELVPRHKVGLGKRLWIDTQYQTLLRSTDRSSSGDERGMEITNINYSANVNQTAFDPHPKAGTKTMVGCRPATLAELSRKVGVPITEPGYIPKGYVPEGRHLFTPSCGCCLSSAQITYTDGLNTISVFENRAGSECKMGCCGPKAGKTGGCEVSCCGVTGTGRITRGKKTIEVVADLPASEIRKIAESVD